MEKVKTLFVRDWDGDRSRVLPQVEPECGWVAAGEGVATVKLDGTCCLLEARKLFKRHQVKPGRTGEAVLPFGFRIAETDEKTGKVIGWLPVDRGPEDQWHREALGRLNLDVARDGTYELIGPKIRGNPERVPEHRLVAHADAPVVGDVPRDFYGLAAWLADKPIEGIVWHHPSGRMAKIKGRDFGIRRPRP